LQQIERQQDSVDERLSELQPQAHQLQQRLNTQQRDLSEDEKRHAVLAGEYDTLHQILHPKPLSKNQLPIHHAKTADLNNDLGNELSITTLREQIELSAKGQQHAELLDSILALWLDSHVLISKQSSDKKINDNSQKADSLWQALEQDLTAVFTYQTMQNENDNSKNKSQLENGHSLWLPAQTNDKGAKSFISALPNHLTDKVLSLSALITAPNLALWQHCYLYIAPSKTNAQQTLEDLAVTLKALPASAILLTSDGW